MFRAYRIVLFLFFVVTTKFALAQYTLSVPFGDGFVGDNSGNNVSSNSMYMSSLGWSNIQFMQNSSTTTFVSQGNDIIGMVLITDANGVEHVINGYVKWRAPSGTVTALVFSPSATTVLATNGSNGSSTYTISSTKYVGLIFNGKTLSIPTSGSNAGKVTGNAATTGLLDQLNNYLAEFPTLTTSDYTIYEDMGLVTVTIDLSAASSNQIKVSYRSADNTATSINDYTTVSGILTFEPGVKSLTVPIAITVDNIDELTERFYLNFTDAVNASITKGMSTVTILDESALGIDLLDFRANCNLGDNIEIYWTTFHEVNCDYFTIEKSSDGTDWSEVSQLQSKGGENSITEYQIVHENRTSEKTFYRLKQIDIDGTTAIYGPISVECNYKFEVFPVYPNPSNGVFSIQINAYRDENVNVQINNASGEKISIKGYTVSPGTNDILLNDHLLDSGLYLITISSDHETINQRLIVH